jgi:hypothetical protein
MTTTSDKTFVKITNKDIYDSIQALHAKYDVIDKRMSEQEFTAKWIIGFGTSLSLLFGSLFIWLFERR